MSKLKDLKIEELTVRCANLEVDKLYLLNQIDDLNKKLTESEKEASSARDCYREFWNFNSRVKSTAMSIEYLDSETEEQKVIRLIELGKVCLEKEEELKLLHKHCKVIEAKNKRYEKALKNQNVFRIIFEKLF